MNQSTPLETLVDQTEESPVVIALRQWLADKASEGNDQLTAEVNQTRDWWAGYKYLADEMEQELTQAFTARRELLSREAGK